MSVATAWPIAYKCGHTEDRDLSFKPAGDRAGYAKWASKKLTCSACFANAPKSVPPAVAAARASEADAATSWALKYDLPTFVGSDGQVAWAIRSRHTLIQSAYDFHVTVGEWDEADFEERVLEPARVLDRPSWWIDNRESLGVDVPELVQSSVTDPRAASTENPL
jgi:hypothetical protein